MTEDETLLREALNYYGRHAQVNKTCEECAELQVELHHWLRNGLVTFAPQEDKVRDEIADVLIIAQQMRLAFGPEAVDARVELKMARLRKRIHGETEPDRWQGPT